MVKVLINIRLITCLANKIFQCDLWILAFHLGSLLGLSLSLLYQLLFLLAHYKVLLIFPRLSCSNFEFHPVLLNPFIYHLKFFLSFFFAILCSYPFLILVLSAKHCTIRPFTSLSLSYIIIISYQHFPKPHHPSSTIFPHIICLLQQNQEGTVQMIKSSNMNHKNFLQKALLSQELHLGEPK